MWKKIKTWLGENTKSFIWFTLITASIITILASSISDIFSVLFLYIFPIFQNYSDIFIIDR